MKYLVLAVLLSVASVASAANYGPLTYDESRASMTLPLDIVTSGLRFTTVETIDVDVSTPTLAGMLAVDSVYALYIATSTGRGGWVKVGAQ